MLIKTTLAAWRKYDATLFNGLHVPNGINRDLLINNILGNSSEFGTLYNDPEAIKQQISILSDRYQWGMERDWRVLHIDYDPLHNYDRHENYTDNETSNSTGTNTVNATEENKNSAKGFNGSTFADTTKLDTTSASTNTASGQSNRQNTHTAHFYGNIGVTKSTEMLMDEHSIVTEIDFYNVWAWKFITELCLCIY